MAAYSAREKRECAELELRRRRESYPSFITGLLITEAEAARQIAMMEAIAADYAAMERGEELGEELAAWLDKKFAEMFPDA